MRDRLCLALACVLACVSLSCRADPTLLTPSRAIAWNDFLGVNAHLLWFAPAKYRQQILLLRALGLQWVRLDVHWAIHEPTREKYRLSELDELVATLAAEKLKSVVYVVGSAPSASSAPPGSSNSDQYPPVPQKRYADFLTLLATRYPSVNAWQLWNEPNLPAFWQPQASPKAYGSLLELGVQAVRKVAPGKQLVMGGMAYYSQMPRTDELMLQALMEQGIQKLDTIIAYHPYSLFPEGDEQSAKDFILRSQTLNTSLRKLQVPAIWATEWGWSSYSGPIEEQPIIGETGQADYLLRRLALMSALDFDRVFLFALSDLDSRATARDQHYGLLALDGSPKPAYTALQRFLQATGTRLLPGDQPELIAPPDELYAVAWRRPDGRRVWMFWSRTAGTLHLRGIKEAQLINPLTGASQPLREVSGVLEVPLAKSLQILEWQ